MTNLYPFLMGDAALKHEKIPYFPAVAERPADHILVAHCGFLGVVPQSFATSWSVQPRVLAVQERQVPIRVRAARLQPVAAARAVVPAAVPRPTRSPRTW